jgi:glycosyltransferase involved in cell wall biosynthesis
LHTFDGIHQGSRTHCLELFSRALELGPEFQFYVFLAEPEKLREIAGKFSQPNVELVKMSHQSAPVRLLMQFPGLARRYRLDLLHTQYIVPPMCPCPTAVTVHDTLFESHPQFFTKGFALRSKVLIRQSARKSALVFTVSEFSRREIVSRYEIAESRTTTIANGVDCARFHPGMDGDDAVRELGLEPGAYLLTVGRLEPRKNHAGLLRAYSRLAGPRPRLAIVGQRDFGYQELFELIETLGIKNDVSLFESIDDALLPALYRHALAFVYPTWAEGFGMPVLEAMASGVPVLTSNMTALPEVAGDAAVYFDPSDTESIAGAIAAIVADRARRMELVERGLKRVEAFGWDGSARKLVDAYARYFVEGS